MSFGFSEDSVLTSTSAFEQQHRCRACFKDSPLCVANHSNKQCVHDSPQIDLMQASIESLPNELIALIMQLLCFHLDRVSLMCCCKRFVRAAALFSLPGPPKGEDLVNAACNRKLQRNPYKVRPKVVWKGEIPFVVTCCEMSLLEYCVHVWNEKVLLLLLRDESWPVDPNLRVHSGTIVLGTLLDWIVRETSVAAAVALLERKEAVDNDIFYGALRLAGTSGNVDMVRALVRFVKSKKNLEKFHEIVRDSWLFSGNADIIELLLLEQGMENPCAWQ